MNATIALLLTQDGLTSGLIYALLALAILLVFLVTRVLWIPAGDLVVTAALTMGFLGLGQEPGVARLLLIMGALALAAHLWRCWRRKEWRGLGRPVAFFLGYPALMWLVTPLVVGPDMPVMLRVLLTVALVVPMGPLLYVAVFRPLEGTSVLTKLIAAVALHIILGGFNLFTFGAEGLRSAALIAGRIDLGFMQLSRQLLLVLCVSAVLMLGLAYFFSRTLWGKALRATAMNARGARLMGIPTEGAGFLTFGIAGLMAALTGILIGPIATIYYDSGFVIGLKAFIGVVCAAMTSFTLAVLGALVVGVLEAFSAFYTSSLRDVIVFSALIPILLWRSLGAVHDHEEE